MRKWTCLLVAMILVLATTTALAANKEVDSILFRGIDWFSTREEVDIALQDFPRKQNGFSKKPEDIDGWYKTGMFFSADPNVDNGGTRVSYEDFTVGGYASEATMYYMFPIVDGLVVQDVDKAQLYKAVYTLDYTGDAETAYKSLSKKLSSLYGEPKNKKYISEFNGKDSMVGKVWTAKDGSLVFLSMYRGIITRKFSDIVITYAAPNVDETLKDLKRRLSRDINLDEVERPRSADINEGL